MIFNGLSILAGFVYIILGIFVMLKFWFFIPLDEIIAYLLGILLIMYGIMRVYRGVKKYMQKND